VAAAARAMEERACSGHQRQVRITHGRHALHVSQPLLIHIRGLSTYALQQTAHCCVLLDKRLFKSCQRIMGT
jgi:hypothetical protein